MKKLYCVVIVERETEEIIKKMEPVKTVKEACSIVKGADINLNHDKYYLQIKDLICPKCKQNEIGADDVMNALSRDNKTYICDDCGTAEAFAEMGGF
jgi:predicted RNA-binding Zn-ribbon protein involved in translation (DUF1610 family)